MTQHRAQRRPGPPSATEAEPEQEPAVEQPAEPPTREPIKFRIGLPMLLRLLRLHPGVTIHTAAVDCETSMVEFSLDVPGAPADAVELLVSYRQAGRDGIDARSTWRTRQDAS